MRCRGKENGVEKDCVSEFIRICGELKELYRDLTLKRIAFVLELKVMCRANMMYVENK